MKEWYAILDKYLLTGKMLSEDYESLSDEQKTFIQEIKRSYARIKYKINGKE